jgi:transposase-like protein
MLLFEKDEPGDSVQVDVKVVKLRRKKVFQYTAIDDCTRYRVLRLYPRENQQTSLHVLGELRRHLPCRIVVSHLLNQGFAWFRLVPQLAARSRRLLHSKGKKRATR